MFVLKSCVKHVYRLKKTFGGQEPLTYKEVTQNKKPNVQTRCESLYVYYKRLHFISEIIKP